MTNLLPLPVQGGDCRPGGRRNACAEAASSPLWFSCSNGRLHLPRPHPLQVPAYAVDNPGPLISCRAELVDDDRWGVRPGVLGVGEEQGVAQAPLPQLAGRVEPEVLEV